MHLPNGSQIFVENSRDAKAIAATAISNANPPAFTLAEGHGLKVGDYVIITDSTWGKILNRVSRVTASAATSVTLGGLDTSDKNQFPAGATANMVKITSWVEIPCVQDLSQDGNEQQYYTYQCLSDDREQQLPTFKSAQTTTYTFAHEYTDAIYPVLRGYDLDGGIYALRMYVPRAKEMRMWSGVMSFNDTPNTTMNEMETVSLSVSVKGSIVSVAA